MRLDNKDTQILETLKENSKLSTYKIARRTLIPVATVHNRIKKLERNGVIQQYSVLLDEKKLGNILTAYVLVHYDIYAFGNKNDLEKLRIELLCLPKVEEVKYITGQFDILLKVRLKDMDELSTIILNKLRKIPGIGQTESIFVLENVK